VLEIAALTHCGLVRESNEDHYAVIRRTRSQEVLASNIELDSPGVRTDNAYLLVVADGVGGIQFGEVASRLALKTIWELADQLSSWVMKLADIDAQFEEVRERVTLAIQRIQRVFVLAADTDPTLHTMGTTITAAYFAGSDAIFVNLGDSRAYLQRNGKLFQQTHDHTLAQEWIDTGAHPDEVKKVRNVLTRCISLMVPDARPDIHYLVVQPGDVVMLCSDGLSDLVSPDLISARLRAKTDAAGMVRDLVDDALAEGGRDNVTVVVARVLDTP
jgi:protein phosphatase